MTPEKPTSNGSIRSSLSTSPSSAKKSVRFAANDEDTAKALANERIQRMIAQARSEPYCPSFNIAFRLLLIVRVLGAIFSNIADCDEVYNYWEPTHYLTHGVGMQTWEYSPVYAIRTWSYIGVHALLVKLGLFGRLLAGGNVDDKIRIFYGVRMLLGAFSAFTEAKLYRAIVEKVEPRVGRYYLFMTLGSVGMWNAAVAYLPSSFAMYTTTLAFAYASSKPTARNTRTVAAVSFFTLGTLLAWPFSGALALPFAVEDLLIQGEDVGNLAQRLPRRFLRLLLVGVLAIAVIGAPIVLIDQMAYHKWLFVPANIVFYNVFGGSERGPNIYGTEPWWFYIVNGFLNFNVVFILALTSLPMGLLCLLASRQTLIKFHRLSGSTKAAAVAIFLRLAPFYFWFAIFTLQPHKEERFLYVAYPLVCVNAAIALLFFRDLVESLLTNLVGRDVRVVQTRKGINRILSMFTASITLVAMGLSGSRGLALYRYYHAPLDIYAHFAAVEWPSRVRKEVEAASSSLSHPANLTATLCIGKEWYRFPSHYFIPDAVRVEFIQSNFEGILPKHYDEEAPADGKWAWPRRTYTIPTGMNDKNRQEHDRYVDISVCDYLVDLDLPSVSGGGLEPNYVADNKLNKVHCLGFLDAQNTPMLERAFYLPFISPDNEDTSAQRWGQYCLLRLTK